MASTLTAPAIPLSRSASALSLQLLSLATPSLVSYTSHPPSPLYSSPAPLAQRAVTAPSCARTSTDTVSCLESHRVGIRVTQSATGRITLTNTVASGTDTSDKYSTEVLQAGHNADDASGGNTGLRSKGPNPHAGRAHESPRGTPSPCYWYSCSGD
jgi:hypothetical protein